jgi:hypothetical protein
MDHNSDYFISFFIKCCCRSRPSMKNINSGTVDALQPGWSDTYLREAWTLFGNIHDHGKLWVLLSDYFETYEQIDCCSQ